MAEQAQRLREFVLKSKGHARVIAVTSGKGGVGKTNTSVNLAIALASRGSRVVLLDADLGLANVEVLLGLNSLYNLQHVIDGEKSHYITGMYNRFNVSDDAQAPVTQDAIE